MKKIKILLLVLVAAATFVQAASAGVTGNKSGKPGRETINKESEVPSLVPVEFRFHGGYANGVTETLVYVLKDESPKDWSELIVMTIVHGDMPPRRALGKIKTAVASSCPEGDPGKVINNEDESSYLEAYCPKSPLTGKAEGLAAKATRVGDRTIVLQRSIARPAGQTIPEMEWIRRWVLAVDKEGLSRETTGR